MYRNLKIAVVILVPTAIVLMFIFREQLIAFSPKLGVCIFHEVTGLHCPGCGNTRCIKALLHGHILTAVRNNASIPFLSVVLAGYYAELTADVFGKKIRIVTRNQIFWWSVLALFMTYFVVRNFIPAIAPIPQI